MGQHTTRPDKFFGIEFLNKPKGRNCYYFFLEADRSTEPQAVTNRSQNPDKRTTEKKMKVYYHWRKAKGPKTDFDIKDFRVLWVTEKSAQRYEKMLALNEMLHDGGWPHFMFAYRDNLFGADNILDYEWRSGDGVLRSLIN